MYSEEVKKLIFTLFSNYSIVEISKSKNISLSTLYRWKKEYDIYIEKLNVEYDEVKDAIKNAKLEELDSYKEQYQDNFKIQSLLITNYTKFEAYDKAIELCFQYPMDLVIQNQLVTVYIRQEMFDEAIRICKKYTTYEPMQGQLVTIYIMKNKLDKAIEVCQKYLENEQLQSQLVAIYIMQNRFRDAIEMCEKNPQNLALQSQLVTIYTKKVKRKDFDKAISICKAYPDYELLQHQLVMIYIKQKKYKEAIAICENYPSNMFFQKQLSEIESLYYEVVIGQSDECHIDIGNVKVKLDSIRTKLADNTITMDDIGLLKELENKIDYNIYKFILISIYHRLGLIRSALHVLKTVDQEYQRQKNCLLNLLTSKKTKFYDLGVYDEIIGWGETTKFVQSSSVKVKKINEN